MVNELSIQHKQLLDRYRFKLYKLIRKGWIKKDLDPYSITFQVVDDQNVYYELIELVIQWIDEFKALPNSLLEWWLVESESLENVWRSPELVKQLAFYIFNSEKKFTILRHLYINDTVFTYNIFDPTRPNIVDPLTGNTQLHNAVLKMNTGLVRRITNLSDVDLTIRNRQGQTALELAIEYSNQIQGHDQCENNRWYHYYRIIKLLSEAQRSIVILLLR